MFCRLRCRIIEFSSAVSYYHWSCNSFDSLLSFVSSDSLLSFELMFDLLGDCFKGYIIFNPPCASGTHKRILKNLKFQNLLLKVFYDTNIVFILRPAWKVDVKKFRSLSKILILTSKSDKQKDNHTLRASVSKIKKKSCKLFLWLSKLTEL